MCLKYIKIYREHFILCGYYDGVKNVRKHDVMKRNLKLVWRNDDDHKISH